MNELKATFLCSFPGCDPRSNREEGASSLSGDLLTGAAKQVASELEETSSDAEESNGRRDN